MFSPLFFELLSFTSGLVHISKEIPILMPCYLAPDHKKDGRFPDLFCKISKLIFLNLMNNYECVTTVIHKVRSEAN